MIYKLKKPQIKTILSSVENGPFLYKATDFGMSKKITGKGVKVSIISSGLPFHCDLKNVNEFEVFSKSKTPDDLFGCSTMVAGIIGSHGANIGGFAPDADLFFAKAYGDSGDSNRANMISAILWSVIKQVDIILICGEIPLKDVVLRDTIKKAYNSNICVFSLCSHADLSEEDQCPELFSFCSGVKGKGTTITCKANEESLTLNNECYTLHGTESYVKISGVALGLGILGGVSTLIVNEEKSSKKPYTPRDIYSRLLPILRDKDKG